MMRGRVGAVAVAFLLLAGMGAASHDSPHITIHSPKDTTYTQQDLVKIDIAAHNGYELVSYESPSAEKTQDLSGDNYTDGEIFPQGHHSLIVTAEKENDTATEHVNFTVDTEGPEVTATYPDETVFERYPELDIRYDDAVSAVDPSSVTVWLDDEEIAGNVTESSFTRKLQNISEGDHTVAIRLKDTHGTPARDGPTPIQWSFTIPEKPVTTDAAPKGLLAGTEASVELTAKDPAGINRNASRFKLVRNENGKVINKVAWNNAESVSSIADGVTVSQTFSDLDEGTYTVEAEVTDNEGNEATTSWTFTVDTTPPSLSMLSHGDGDVVTGEQTFTAEATDALSAVDRVIMTLGGEQERVYTAVNDKFHADIDTDNVADGEQTLTIGAKDKAQNTVETAVDLLVDNTAPDVKDVSVYPETVPAAAQVTATVTDTATGIDHVSYRVVGTNVTGTLVPEDGALDSDTEAVQGRLDVTSLDDGIHEITLVAKDGAGHRTTRSTIFTVNASRQASLTMKRSDAVFVDAGSSKTVTVRVANTGDADDLVALSSSTDVVNDILPAEKRIRAGETKGFDVTVSPSANAAPGPRTVPVTIQGLGQEAHAELQVRVQPRPAVQQDIEQRLQTLQDRFSDMTASKDEYDDSVDAGETEETFSETRATLNEIESLIEDGKYYRASERLDDAESQLDEADTALTGMISSYKRKQMISTGLKILGLLIVIGIAFGVYRLRPEEEGFDTEDGFIMHEDDRHPLEQVWDNARQAVQERIAAMQEAEEQQEASTAERQPDGWNGFDARN